MGLLVLNMPSSIPAPVTSRCSPRGGREGRGGGTQFVILTRGERDSLVGNLLPPFNCLVHAAVLQRDTGGNNDACEVASGKYP